MGKDFELIAQYLGLSLTEIDQIKMDHKFSSNVTIHHILQKWKSKLGHGATLENLEKSLRDAEEHTNAQVHWDAFNQAKATILKLK
jgi:hypothetical protein